MSVTKVVRYRTNPQDAAENARLIRDVFAELAAGQPDGLRYASFQLDDGVTFVHVAELDGDHNPLLDSAAFAKFQSGIKDRCADGPVASDATVIGSYRAPGRHS
jgi:acyl dehydratase